MSTFGTGIRTTLPLAAALLFCASALCAQPATLRFTQQGSELELQISDRFSAGEREELKHWIEFISRSLLQVYGRWPRDYWRITVDPTSASSRDPVPWARVVRGDVDRVEFYTIGNPDRKTLQADWTGYHELAHLLIPYRGSGDLWFSEGLASYYQNILQARSGVFDERQMWQELHDGFERGRSDERAGQRPLQEVSANLHDHGAYLRIHWSGVWYFLVADTRLRQQSGGRRDLDQALERLNRCCADQQLSVPEIVRKLDQLNRVVLFRPLYEQLVVSTAVPDHRGIFSSLGISLEEQQVKLQTLGPGAKLRVGFSAPKTL